MAEYLIQDTTLASLGNAARHISGGSSSLTLTEMLAQFNNSISKDNVYSCYVGMMPPNDSVGKDGDIFFLV